MFEAEADQQQISWSWRSSRRRASPGVQDDDHGKLLLEITKTKHAELLLETTT
jgi:hypothetical protein